MARVPVLKPEEMTDEQKRVDAEIGSTRSGRAGGPLLDAPPTSLFSGQTILM